jgi:hypothetical protein
MVTYYMTSLEKGVTIAFDHFEIQGIVGTPKDEDRVTVHRFAWHELR